MGHKMETKNILKLCVVLSLFMLSLSLVVGEEDPNDWKDDLAVSKWTEYVSAGKDVNTLWTDLSKDEAIRNNVLTKISAGENGAKQVGQLVSGLNQENLVELINMDSAVISKTDVLGGMQVGFRDANSEKKKTLLDNINGAFTQVSKSPNNNLLSSYKVEIDAEVLSSTDSSLTYDDAGKGIVAKFGDRELFVPIEGGVPKDAVATKLRGPSYTPDEGRDGIGANVVYEKDGGGKVALTSNDVSITDSPDGTGWIAEVGGQKLELGLAGGGTVVIGGSEENMKKLKGVSDMKNVVSTYDEASVSLGAGKESDSKYPEVVSVKGAGEDKSGAFMIDDKGNLDVVGGTMEVRINPDSGGRELQELKMTVGVSGSEDLTRVNLFGDAGTKPYEGEKNVFVVSRKEKDGKDVLMVEGDVEDDANVLFSSNDKFEGEKFDITKGESHVELGDYAETGYLRIDGGDTHTTPTSAVTTTVNGVTVNEDGTVPMSVEEKAKLKPYTEEHKTEDGLTTSTTVTKGGKQLMTKGEIDPSSGNEILYWQAKDGSLTPYKDPTSGPSSGNLNRGGTCSGGVCGAGAGFWFPGKYAFAGARGVLRGAARVFGWVGGGVARVASGVGRSVGWAVRGIARVFGWLFGFRLHLVLLQLSFLVFFEMAKFGLGKHYCLE
jgi:hypothetical protein